MTDTTPANLTPTTVPAVFLPDPDQFLKLRRKVSNIAQLTAWFNKLRWKLALIARPAVKRAVDIGGAAVGLLVLSPLLVCTALAIKIESRGPVFFNQVRVGKRGRPFTMLKFRSMGIFAETDKQKLMASNESADGVLFKMKQDPRITRVGRLIRRFSIDELPQLFNILRGDMSVVGPRPALPREVEQYDALARKRLHTKPGLTCIWQISGRSDIPFSQQVQLDLRYLQSKSVATDLAIILRTIPAVLSGKGAY